MPEKIFKQCSKKEFCVNPFAIKDGYARFNCFNLNNYSKDGKQAYCKYCQKEFDNIYNKSAIGIASQRVRKNKSGLIKKSKISHRVFLNTDKSIKKNRYNRSMIGIAGQKTGDNKRSLLEKVKMGKIELSEDHTFLTKEQFRIMMFVADNKCVITGKPIEDLQKLSLDHVVPMENGGLDNIENIVVCHEAVNNSKNSYSLEYFCNFWNYDYIETLKRIEDFHNKYYEITQLIFILYLFGYTIKFEYDDINFYRNGSKVEFDLSVLLVA